MKGFELSEGRYKTGDYSEEELWDAFENVFSTKTRNTASYKFVFLKSIMDCICKYNKVDYTFYEIFYQFTKIYWILIVKYGLVQNNSKTKETYIEQILKGYVGCSTVKRNITIQFNDLTPSAKENIVVQVTKKCQACVVGALYGDTKGLIYSFSKQKELLWLNPTAKDFLLRNKASIEKSNYIALAKFMEKINSEELMNKIIQEKGCRGDDLPGAYEQLLYDEFGCVNIL